MIMFIAYRSEYFVRIHRANHNADYIKRSFITTIRIRISNEPPVKCISLISFALMLKDFLDIVDVVVDVDVDVVVVVILLFFFFVPFIIIISDDCWSTKSEYSNNLRYERMESGKKKHTDEKNQVTQQTAQVNAKTKNHQPEQQNNKN